MPWSQANDGLESPCRQDRKSTPATSRHPGLFDIASGSAAREEADAAEERELAGALWRDSILLGAGDKAGRWKEWYREAIPWPNNATSAT